MTTERTLFQKMWDGDIPSYEIFRSETHGFFVKPDAYPATLGHALVIPREQVEDWTELPDYRFHQLQALSKLVAKWQIQILQPVQVMPFISGFGVPHVHQHLVPIYDRAEIKDVLAPERVAGDIDYDVLKTTQETLCFPHELQEHAEAVLAETHARFAA